MKTVEQNILSRRLGFQVLVRCPWRMTVLQEEAERFGDLTVVPGPWLGHGGISQRFPHGFNEIYLLDPSGNLLHMLKMVKYAILQVNIN